MSAINYDLTKIKAFVFDVDGVLSPSTIPMSPDGVPMRMANLKDGYAMQLAVKKGYKFAIITGADVPSIKGRFGVIGVRDIFLGAGEKLPILHKWMADNGLSPEEVVYCGDDIPDMPPMRAVGLSVAPRDAADEVKAISAYISHADGGYGVARDIIESVLRVQGQWLTDSKAYAW